MTDVKLLNRVLSRNLPGNRMQVANLPERAEIAVDEQDGRWLL